MKKIITATAVVLALSISSVFAMDGVTNKAVAASFRKDFTSAREISWQKQQNFNVAAFNLDGQYLMAYYNQDGTLIAVMHHTPVDHLPIFLQKNLKKNFGNYWVSELFEAAMNGDSHYYVTVENADEKLKLKSVNGTDWTIEKRTKKDVY